MKMTPFVKSPVIGRFLSPDPYVQFPDFSQSYNRYSYCLNNPLKHVDPGGKKMLQYYMSLYENEGGGGGGFWYRGDYYYYDNNAGFGGQGGWVTSGSGGGGSGFGGGGSGYQLNVNAEYKMVFACDFLANNKGIIYDIKCSLLYIVGYPSSSWSFTGNYPSGFGSYTNTNTNTWQSTGGSYSNGGFPNGSFASGGGWVPQNLGGTPPSVTPPTPKKLPPIGISFNRGIPQFETNFINKNWGAVTPGPFIFYSKGTMNNPYFNTHEPGHVIQYLILGPLLYYPLVAIPSLITAPTNYHNNMPWEKSANQLWYWITGENDTRNPLYTEKRPW